MPFCSYGPRTADENFTTYEGAAAFLGDQNRRGFIATSPTITRGENAGQANGAWDSGGGLRRHPDGRIGVRYHATDVLTLYPDGSIEASTGGWDTQSTSNWINSHPYLDCELYVPRGRGEPDPNRRSTIRWAKYDERLRQTIRSELSLEGENRYISTFETEWNGDLGKSVPVDPDLLERRRAYHQLFAERRTPTYIFEDGITFTKRGACNGRPHADFCAELAAERDERRRVYAAAKAMAHKAVRRLRRGIAVHDCEWCAQGAARPGHFHDHIARRTVSGTMIRTAVERWLAAQELDSRNAKNWLGWHFTRNDTLVMGGAHLPELVVPQVRTAVYEYIKIGAGLT